MTNTQNVLITLSLVGWLLVLGIELIRRRGLNWVAIGLQFVFALIITYVLHRYFNYFNTIETKGNSLISESWLLVWLYVFTVLGILCHHIFVQIKASDKRGKQPRLKWFPFLKPLTISPIVFITFLSQFDKMGAEITTLTTVSIQFGLAFQNGFFWKAIFDLLQDSENK